MACKLQGPVIETVHGSDILSDGIVEGSVQVSSSGQPIVMLADHQTTGGYAKIATVISADLPALAQLRPGQQVAFTLTDPARAVAATRTQAACLKQLGKLFLQATNRPRGRDVLLDASHVVFSDGLEAGLAKALEALNEPRLLLFHPRDRSAAALHLDGDGAAPQEGRTREGLVVPAQEASSPAVELSVGLGILSIA